MDYKKKYYEAQKWIESIYSELSHEQQMEAEAFFPELKESEDEKIRKWLIAQLKIKIGDNIILNNMIYKALDWLEKQGEQKPADKVEPKFHKSDWIVTSYGKVNQVIAVDEDCDGFTLDDDTYFSGSWKDGYHLWTIQDAKDGDVLYCKSDCGVEFIVMSKGVNNRNNIDSYFRYNSDDGFGIDIPNVLSAKQDNITPATKEQRDILFKKMKEAGFEWDSEKKELKKISQRMISAKAKEAMYDKPTDNDMVEALRTEYEKGRADVLRCIDPDEMVADFCSQPLSKTRSLASIYRQGIIDIIKRINRNEETSITSTHSIDDGGVQLPKP